MEPSVSRPQPPGDPSTGPYDWSATPTAADPKSGGGLCVPGYELLDVLGRGGMGVVYRARQLALGRTVAVKLVLTARLGPAEEARFLNEAKALARVQHPNIVPIYEVGRAGSGPFFSMEYVPGGSLARRLADGPLPPRDAADLVATLARAVHAAHAAGILHRDLKPGNILLANAEPETRNAEVQANGSAFPVPRSPFPVVKVADFGLAKQLEGGPGLTASGAVLGTPGYMAPEQAGGGQRVGPPADVYALGAILYECLTGRPPFRAATAVDTLLQSLTDEPVPARRLNPAVPRDLETVCRKCLEKDPTKRYESAQKLADDLHRFLDGRPTLARPIGPAGQGWRWCRRNPRLAAALAAVALVLVAGAGTTTAMWLKAEDRRAQASEERDRADRRLDLAVRNNLAVGDLAEQLRPLVGTQAAVVGRIMTTAAANYDRMLAEAGDDPPPTLTEGKARMLTGFSDLYLDLNRSGDALRSAREAAGHWQALLAIDPERPDWRAGRVTALRHLGRALEVRGDSDAALEARLAAVAGSRERIGRQADSPDARHELATSLRDLAQSLYSRSDQDRQRPIQAEALAIWTDLAARPDARPEWQYEYAQARRQAGRERWIGGDYPAALSEYEEARRAAEELVRLYPDRGPYRHAAARARFGIGQTHLWMGRIAQARQELEAARSEFAALVDQDPGNVAWARSLFDAERARNDLLPDARPPTRARLVSLLEDRLAINRNERDFLQRLCDADPDNAELLAYRVSIDQEVGTTTAALGILGVRRAESLAAALHLLRQTVPDGQRLARLGPALPHWASFEAEVRGLVANTLWALDRRAEAAGEEAASLHLFRQWQERHARAAPADRDRQRRLAGFEIDLARSLFILAVNATEPTPHLTEAREVLHVARRRCEALIAAEPEAVGPVEMLIQVDDLLRDINTDLGREADAQTAGQAAARSRSRLARLRREDSAAPPGPGVGSVKEQVDNLLWAQQQIGYARTALTREGRKLAAATARRTGPAFLAGGPVLTTAPTDPDLDTAMIAHVRAQLHLAQALATVPAPDTQTEAKALAVDGQTRLGAMPADGLRSPQGERLLAAFDELLHAIPATGP